MRELIENGYAINYGEVNDSDLESVVKALENNSKNHDIVETPQNEAEEMLLGLADIENGELYRYQKDSMTAYLIHGQDALLVYGEERMLKESIPGTSHWESVNEALSEDFDPDPDEDY